MRTASAVVASMDMISVSAFALPCMRSATALYSMANTAFYFKVYAVLALIAWSWGLVCVAVLSYYATYRNTNKIKTLINDLCKQSYTPKLFMNFALSLLIAVVAFISQCFALIILLPSSFGISRYLHTLLAIIYATYTFFNTCADLEKATIPLARSSSKKSGGLLNQLLTMSSYDRLYAAGLSCAMVATSYFKLTRTTISLASMASRYGGIYCFLEGFNRLFSFPTLMIGFYNVVRCKDAIKQLWSERTRSYTQSDYIITSAIVAAAYTKAVSSKLLNIAPQSFIGLLFIDYAANSTRQCKNIYSHQPTESKDK